LRESTAEPINKPLETPLDPVERHGGLIGKSDRPHGVKAAILSDDPAELLDLVATIAGEPPHP